MAARRKKATRNSAEREFVSEAEEVLDRLRADLFELGEQRRAASVGGDDAPDVDPDLLNGIFRSAHSLKGSAGMFGFDAMADLAHHLEDVLGALRMGRLDLDSPAVGVIDDAVTLASDLLVSVGDEARAEGDSARVAAMIERMSQAAADDAKAPESEIDALDIDPSMLRALTEYEEHRLAECLRKGRHISLVETSFDMSNFEEGLAEVSAAVREVGEVVSMLPSPGAAPESHICFSLLAATRVTAEQLGLRLEFPDTRVQVIQAGNESGALAAAGASEASEGDTDASDASAVAAAPRASSEFESLRSISETVRVDIRKLDELMTLVGELVIQRSALGGVTARLLSEKHTQRVGAEVAKIHKSLGRKLKELQSGVLDVRMVPLRQVFEKLSRVVRRLRRDLDKDVRIDFKGADTELDKLIVEQLIDPLVHIVRNAFDHAIEAQDERVQAGKPIEGSIRVEASQRGNHVVIEVVDDGRGIAADRVRAKAEAVGLVTPETQLTTKETLALVFEPGLSTRDEVSETSGRGVGMDVVRSNLTSLGGLVDLDSELGVGTTVTLTVPITLAIIQALFVAVGDQHFAIPLNGVLETLLVEPSDIQRSEGREILNLRGEPLPLRRLATEFDIEPSPNADGSLYAVVLGLGELRMGLLVDQLEGQQDTVIKPIQGPVRQVRGISGATEMGGQGATLVLDVSSFVEDAVRRRDAA